MTEQTRDILITGASLLGGEATDIALSGGIIVAIGADARDAVRDPRVIDAEGLIALPGLVDIHTHLRQPGGEDAETVFTGTRAAAVGGYTAVHAMANTTPTQDTAAIVDQVLRLGEEAGALLPPRRSREEREVVERAKERLMARNGMTEEEAHRALRRRSMDRRIPLADAARMLLDEERPAP